MNLFGRQKSVTQIYHCCLRALKTATTNNKPKGVNGKSARDTSFIPSQIQGWNGKFEWQRRGESSPWPLVATISSLLAAGTLTMKKEDNTKKGKQVEDVTKGFEEDEKAKTDEKQEAAPFAKEFPLLEKMPVETAVLTAAPNVPPPIQRRHPVRLVVHLEADVANWQLTRENKFHGWAFNGTVPSPFIRAREGDVLEVHLTNRDMDGVAHNIDFHAVLGPGGGAPLLFAEKEQTKVARFRLLYPGLFMYHCAAAPIPMHIANGMYGLILVEPAADAASLPPVDKEFYVMQSEFYAEPSLDDPKLLEYSYSNGLAETPQAVVFNGRDGALTDRPLMADQGDRVRIYFGNAGPNLAAAFHVIGTVFDRVYRDGGLMDRPARGIQTQLVPPGSATCVELLALVPGTFTLVDHAIHRIDKGAVGYLKVSGKAREDIYSGEAFPVPCPGCKLHE